MNRLVLVPWLVVLWLMLWRDVSVANVLSGVAVALIVSVGLRLDWVERRPGIRWIRPLAMLGFLGYFAWKLLQANLIMAKEIVTPRNRIQTGIIAIPMHRYGALVTTVTANAVSLTPGTLTVEVSASEPSTIYVHVLHLHDTERARRDVYSMAERAAHAFGDRPDPIPDDEVPR